MTFHKIRFRSVVFLIGLILLNIHLGIGQDLNAESKLGFKAFDTSDGLSSAEVYNTYEDKYGFLWLSTEEGIIRYDGYEFISYFDDASKEVHLKGAGGFHEDKYGRLWLVSGAGYLYHYDRISDEFIYHQSSLESGWQVLDAHEIEEDAEGNIWYGVHGGLQYYDNAKDTVVSYPISKIRAPESWPHEEKVWFGVLHLEDDKFIWAGTRKFGFVKFDITSGEYTFYRFDPRYDRKYLAEGITDIVPWTDHLILISEQETGLIIWDTEREEINRIVEFDKLLKGSTRVTILDMHPLDDQKLWLATQEHGLLLFDVQENKILEHYTVSKDKLRSIQSNTVKHINRSKRGFYLLSTNVFELASPELYKFTELRNDPEDPNSLRGDNIYNLSTSKDGKLLVSTAAGPSIYDPVTQSFDNSISFGENSLQSYGFASDSKNNLWIGMVDNLYELDRHSFGVLGKYNSQVVLDSFKNTFRRACRIMEDSQENIWTIDHWGRLKKIDQGRSEIKNIFELAQDPLTGEFVNVNAALDDPENSRVIAAMDQGLAFVSYDKKKINRIKVNYNGIDLSKSNFTFLYRDQQDLIWSIVDGQLYILNISDDNQIDLSDNEQLTQIQQAYDIGSFRWIVAQADDSYWLGSHRGIVQYDKSTGYNKLYYTDNIGGYTFDSPSEVAQLDGKIYFSGLQGISVLDTDRAEVQVDENEITLCELKINHQSYTPNASIQDLEEIDLSYYQNNLDVKFSSLEIINQQDTRYAYRLLPADESWKDIGQENSLSMLNLPPSDYTLQFKAMNPDGQWSNTIRTLNVNIIPAWWDRPAAQILYVLLSIGILLLGQRYLYRLQLKKQKEIENLRTKISSDLHDDVGSMLTGIAMQSELMESYASPQVKSIAKKIATNSRTAMSQMRDTVWAIDNRKDKTRDLRDRLLDFVNDNIDTNKIAVNIDSNLTINNVAIKPNIRQNVYLIAKESINNIAKHSDTNKIDISLNLDKKKLLLNIKDYGSLKEHKSSGQGFRNMRDRAQNINADYSFQYQQNGFETNLVVEL